MPPIPRDYHTHTAFSSDCDIPMAVMCERAIAVGLREICFTDHADFMPQDPGRGYLNPDAYFAELTRCRERYGDRLTILAGAELSEPQRFPVEAAQLVAGRAYDVIIGSLHWVGDELALEADYFAGKAADDAYAAYFTELPTVAQAGGFDVLAHLDVPKRGGYDAHGVSYDPARFAEPIRAALRACVENGIGLEINTGTLRRAVAETSPSLTVLRWYRELGGELLTVGSDAHTPAALAHGFDVARDVALAAGFSRLACYRERRPGFAPLT